VHYGFGPDERSCGVVVAGDETVNVLHQFADAAERATLDGLGLALEATPGPLSDYYYGLIDLEFWLRTYVGEDVARFVKQHVHPLDAVFRLAHDHGIVLLNGGGFHAPDWSVRVSFANLEDDVYDDIGHAVRAIAQDYVRAYHAAKPARSWPWRRRHAC
jgi:hypothetical protein